MKNHQIMQIKEMTTFAEMARIVNIKKLKRGVKMPHWFPLLRRRKDLASLTAIEQQRFLCAFEMLNQSGQLGQFVSIHAATMAHRQHGTLRFLPWHRVMLFVVESALEAFHPDVTIPYWDWTNPTEQQIPLWLQRYTPLVNTPTGNIQVVRAPGTQTDLATIVSNIPSIMDSTTFPYFSMDSLGGIELPHDYVHGWVGGSMSAIATAPADPIFFMHHTNIDRLWWDWQNGAGNGINPALTGEDSIMDPWSYSEPDTRKINQFPLGYQYI
jgi:tyrosinase